MPVAFQPDAFQNNAFQTSNYPVGSISDAYGLTVAGVPRDIRSGTFRISSSINARDTMSFEIVSENGTYRPTFGDEVVYTWNTTRLFAGLIDTPTEQGLFATHGGRPLVNGVNSVDFNEYAEWRYVDGIIPAGTLKDALLVIVAYLAPYGVTLDPAQVTGPSVPLLYLPTRKLRDVMDELSVTTGYVWEIDYNKIMRMFPPGSQAAPFNIVPASDPTVLVGDVAVEHDHSNYANRVIVLAGEGTRDRTDTFTGDGSTRVFVLLASVNGHPVVLVNGVSVPVGIHGVDTDLEWTYRASDNAVVQLADAPPGTPHAALTGADTLTVTYAGNHPFRAQADDVAQQALRGLRERSVPEKNVYERDQAQALADGYLAQFIITYQRVSYATRRRGLRKGQTQTITIPARNVSGTFLITDVDTTDTVGNAFHYTVRAVGGLTIPPSWRDFYKGWGGGRSGTASPAVSGGTGGTAVVLSSPASLGGSRNTSSAPNPAAWTPVPDYVPFTAQASFGGRVRADLFARNAGVTATCRLYNVTDAAVVAVSSGVTSQTATEVTFLVGLTLGKKYRLEVISSGNGEGVFCIGVLESA